MLQHGEMENERRPCEPDFESIIKIFNPGLTQFEEKNTKNRIPDNFNGTPAQALRIMADGMQAGIISRVIPWFRYGAPNERLRGNDNLIKMFQAMEDHMYPVYARSGLYPALGPYFRGGLSVGTPAMIIEENLRESGKIECTVPHPRENFFRFDAFGVPVQYHRLFEKTITDLVIDLKQRRIDFSAMSAATQTAITNGTGGTKVKILQVYYRDDDPIFDGLKVSGRLGDILPQRPWRTYLMEMNADAGTDGNTDGNKVPFEAQGYFYRPHVAWRFEVGTDETYARTPARFALHDARGEISASKTLQEAGEGFVRPPYLATQDMRHRIRRKPASTTYKATAQSTVESMPNSGKNYPISSEERDRLVNKLEAWFDVPFYLMLLRNLAAGGTPPTATQVIGAEGEQGRIRGTKFERISRDMLEPIDDAFFAIERNSGRLPQPEEFGINPEDLGLTRVDADFIGPLLQAQKKAFVVRRILDGLGISDEFFKNWPNLRHKIDSEDLYEKALEAVGFEQTAIKSKDEFAEIMEDIAAREAEKQQLEAGLAVADAVPNVSKTVEPGSPLAAAVQ